MLLHREHRRIYPAGLGVVLIEPLAGHHCDAYDQGNRRGEGQYGTLWCGRSGALARKGDAEEVAELISFLLSPNSSFVNGVTVPIDGGWIC